MNEDVYFLLKMGKTSPSCHLSELRGVLPKKSEAKDAAASKLQARQRGGGLSGIEALGFKFGPL